MKLGKMGKIISDIVLAFKKKYYLLYYNIGGFISFGNIFYFLGLSVRTIFYLISDYFTNKGETVCVKIEQGELRGRKVKSVLGKTYYSFRGVPYAAPPVGPLRFKDTQPPECWTKIRKATQHGSISAQWDWLTRIYLGRENSLFLNVYTPKIPQNDEVSFNKKAVLLWIHGGAFFFGFSNDILFGPDLFMSEDVILVTINYRLGPLGFFSTGTKHAPGNAGFKDIIQALKWVKKNISNFGGDPENVTVFGESAGACMAEILMVSPLAKGLFHKAIAQSGNGTSWWSFNENLIDSSFNLGKNLGIKTNDPKVLIESLQKLSPREIALKQRHSLSDKREKMSIPFDFVLCSEPEDYPNAALTSNPRDMIRQGKFICDIPFMTGLNEKEGLSMLHTILLDYPKIKEFDKDFEKMVPTTWNLEHGSTKSKEAAAEIRKFYLKGKPLNESTFDEFVDLATDIHFLEPVLTSVKSHLKYLKSPVYIYRFNIEGYRNIYKRYINLKNIKGPTHTDEAFYLFHVPGLGNNLNKNDKEAKNAKRIVRLWSNFAKYGNPTPDPEDSLLQKKIWPAATKEGCPHFIIGDDLILSNDVLWKERVKFWNDLKAKYAPDA